MSTIIQDIERNQLRNDLPEFAPGDRVRVHFLVIEGNRKRPQVFEGVVIKRQGSGARETFTVRKQSFGVGVERTFPLHSPKIEKLEVASRGRVRRAKLYYLRGRTGKAARVAERRWGIDDDVVAAGATGAVDASGEGLAPEAVPEAEAPEAVEAEGEAVENEEAGETPVESAADGSDGTAEATESTSDEKVEEPVAEESEPADDGGTEDSPSDDAEAPSEGEEEPAAESDSDQDEAGEDGEEA